MWISAGKRAWNALRSLVQLLWWYKAYRSWASRAAGLMILRCMNGRYDWHYFTSRLTAGQSASNASKSLSQVLWWYKACRLWTTRVAWLVILHCINKRYDWHLLHIEANCWAKSLEFFEESGWANVGWANVVVQSIQIMSHQSGWAGDPSLQEWKIQLAVKSCRRRYSDFNWTSQGEVPDCIPLLLVPLEGAPYAWMEACLVGSSQMQADSRTDIYIVLPEASRGHRKWFQWMTLEWKQIYRWYMMNQVYSQLSSLYKAVDYITDNLKIIKNQGISWRGGF